MAQIPADSRFQGSFQSVRPTGVRIVSAAGERKQWTLPLTSDMTSVLQIKQRISELEDDHPEPGIQKLIHMGKILQDEDDLEEIFSKRHSETPDPTFYLVVKPTTSSGNVGFVDTQNLGSTEGCRTTNHSTFSSSTRPHIETAASLRSRMPPSAPVIVTHSPIGVSTSESTATQNSQDETPNISIDSAPQTVHLPIYYQVVLINNEPHLLHIPGNPINTLETRTPNTITQSFVVQGNIVQPVPVQPINLQPLPLHNIQPQVQDPLHAQARVYRLRIRMREVWLFVRLAFMVGLFSSGNFSWPRFLMLNLIATLIFVYQTGRANGARNVFNFQEARTQNGQVANSTDPNTARVASLLHTVQQALLMFLTSLVPSDSDHRNRRDNNQQPGDAGILPVG